jgi:thiamine transporter ThiT
MIYMLVTTFSFGFIYGFVTIWLAGILQLKEEFEKVN